jgi:CDP-glycerol glycerophosphotransferase (TagB/SpsB family)
MKILFVSIGLGQHYCIQPVEDELRSRGCKTHSICAWSGGVLNSMTLKSIYDYNDFDAVVCTGAGSLISKFKKEGIKPKLWITMYHGCSAKNSLDSWVINKDRDLLIVPGELWLNYWLTMKDIDINKPKVVIGGFPKTDFIVNNKHNTNLFKKLIRMKYHMNKNPIILYAPTFSTGKTTSSHGTLYQLSNIYKEFKDAKLNLLVAAHPGDMTGHVVNEVLDDRKFDGVKYCFNFNKNEEILGSDLVISDSSSIAFEASLIGKPVIQYIPEDNAVMLRTYSRVTEEEMILGPVLFAPRDNAKLIQTVKDLLIEPRKYAKEQEFWSSKLNSGCDGNSTKRCADIIEKEINRKKNG